MTPLAQMVVGDDWGANIDIMARFIERKCAYQDKLITEEQFYEDIFKLYQERLND